MPPQSSHPPLNRELLAAYVAGNASHEVSQQIELAVSTDESMLRRLRDYRHIWEASAGLPIKVDAESAWTNVLVEVVRRKRWRARRLAGISAVTAAAAVASVIAFLVATPPSPSPSHTNNTVQGSGNEYATSNGERREIRLPDGTTVKLNVASRLRVPSSFVGGRDGEPGSARIVELEGEALFNVAHNSERAFRVRTRSADIKVLGTVFGVRSYPSSKTSTPTASGTGATPPETRVVVASGRVAVAAVTPNGGHAQVATLVAGDVASITPTGSATVDHPSNVSDQLAWTDGRLVFNNAPVREVVAELERWYNLRIEVRSAAVGTRVLTTTFVDKQPPTPTQLDDMAAAVGARIERTNGVIRFVSTSDK